MSIITDRPLIADVISDVTIVINKHIAAIFYLHHVRLLDN